MFRAWSRRLSDFGVTLDPLFQSISVHDPANPHGRESALSWWPTESVRALQEDCQRHFDRWPGTRGPIHLPAYYTRQGEIDTLQHLWQHKDNQEKVAAILLADSLFSRMQSRRARYPDNWPKFSCVKVLADWAYATWQGPGPHTMWHPSCTEVLPATSEDYVYKIDTMDALVQYFTEEHASLLRKHRPVVIEYGPERDLFVARVLQREYEAEKQRGAEWQARWEKQKTDEKERLERLKKQSPRWGEWGSISNAELEELVWSKPTSQVAREFGISDVAIGKRCKAAGIPKPPPGFWRKVEAGQLPHPNGKPIDRK